jgi:hypothetical protein
MSWIAAAMARTAIRIVIFIDTSPVGRELAVRTNDFALPAWRRRQFLGELPRPGSTALVPG